jgi:V/A-type H+-transporting ATPase subunit I
MAVEKMKIMGVIGKVKLTSRILRLVVLNGSLHMINALSRVNSSDFILPPNEKNIEALEELPFLKSYSSKRDFSRDEEVVKSLMDLFNIRPEVLVENLGQDYDYDDYMKNLSGMYEKIKASAGELKERTASIEKKNEYINNLRFLEQSNIDVGRLTKMKYLTFRLIKLPKENYTRLKQNYENIPAVVKKVAVEGRNAVLVSITPNSLEETAEKIFGSLNYTQLSIPEGYEGTASQIIAKLRQSIDEDRKVIDDLKKSLEEYKRQNLSEIEKAYSRLEMEKKVEELKSNLAFGKNLFFMFGFVPVSRVNELKEELEGHFKDDIIILIDDVDSPRAGLTPPTKLSNIGIFRPFESLVKMYGTPAYNEKDPTVFFGLTYMLLFGLMFGDVGQGLVLFLSGLILEFAVKRKSLGGVLARIGASSTLFGFFYGSVFGSEEIIPPLIVRPMANINYMLISAVVIGVILITAGFIYNILNSSIQKNLEEGVFGRNGVVGLAFYLLLIYIIASLALGRSGYTPAEAYIMAILLLLMVFKQPLSNKLTGAPKLYSEPPADYYVEEGFGVIETLLSMLSNTISFIRVGAFALNHVGLYIAFATMARMAGSKSVGIVLLVLGNVVIIGLEGLIVFIQALRLEYYELFSKYFRGDGIEYVPVKLPVQPRVKRSLHIFRMLRAAGKKSVNLKMAI